MDREPKVEKLSHIFHMQHNKIIPRGSVSWYREYTPTILNGCHLDLLASSDNRIALPFTAGADSFNT